MSDQQRHDVMKTLVITGRRATEIVRNYVGDLAEVAVADVDVAALLTPQILYRLLKKIDLSDYDLILLPGNVTSNFSELEREFGVKIRLGTRYAHDLPDLLANIDEIELSDSVPARRSSERDFETIKKELLELEATGVPEFMIRGVKIGGNTSMKVMAEIVDATLLRDEELEQEIRYFESEGADIIDLGVTLDAEVDDVKRILAVAKSVTELPVSLDTMEPALIEAGISSGADLILSLDRENIEAVGEDIAKAEISAVVISRSGVDELFEVIDIARSLGIDKIVADPILSPVGEGIARSIHDYYRFREIDKSTPLFFGVGNVTELIDADSVGINAVLAGIGMELGIGILFAPEASRKTMGSVNELVKASMMMQLASKRQSPPKDLGIDLFVAKEKRKREGVLIEELDDVVTVTEKQEWKSDPLGYFRIAVQKGMIYLEHNMPDGRVEIIRGLKAKEIIAYLAKTGKISMIDHAGYLGVELAKAELAIRLRRSYVQDEEI